MSRLTELINELCPDGVEYRELRGICKLTAGEFVHKRFYVDDGDYPIFNGGRTYAGLYDKYNNEAFKVVVSTRGAYAGYVNVVDKPFWAGNSCCVLNVIDSNLLDYKYLFHCMRAQMESLISSQNKSSIPSVSQKQLYSIKIPVPPVEVQREIVQVLDEYTAVHDELVNELKRELEMHAQQKEAMLEQAFDLDDVEYKKLGDIVKIETGKLNANAAVLDGRYAFFTTAKEVSRIDSYRWDTEAILIAGNANVGDVKHYVGKFNAYQRTYVLTEFAGTCYPRYLYYLVKGRLKKHLESRKNEGAMTYIVLSDLKCFDVPIPSIDVQYQIVDVLDRFFGLLSKIESALEDQISDYNLQLSALRNELLTFPDVAADQR